MTKASDQTVLGQGLALGTIMLGVDSVMAQKQRLELDFRRAWRAWPHRDKFSQIKAGPESDDLLHILNASGRSPRSKFAFWASEWPFIPVLEFEHWSYKDVAESIDDTIPAEAWRELAVSWLSQFHEAVTTNRDAH